METANNIQESRDPYWDVIWVRTPDPCPPPPWYGPPSSRPPPNGMVPQAHALGNAGHGTIHACMHASMHPSIHPYIHTDTHTQTDIPIYLPTYIPTYLRTYVPTYTRTYIPTYIHTYKHTYIHTNIPTYQHTNIPTYHHHRPQGGGPEEPYHHHRPQGGGTMGGEGGGAWESWVIYIRNIGTYTIGIYISVGHSHIWMERKQQIYGDVYVIRITERPRLESNLRKIGKQPWGAESWKWGCDPHKKMLVALPIFCDQKWERKNELGQARIGWWVEIVLSYIPRNDGPN